MCAYKKVKCVEYESLAPTIHIRMSGLKVKFNRVKPQHMVVQAQSLAPSCLESTIRVLITRQKIAANASDEIVEDAITRDNNPIVIQGIP